MTISLCMIVKNEEAVLGRCLESAAGVAEEVIVVDTGSQDGTRAVAEAHGARVYDFDWIDDFAAARNYSFSLAKMDYCLWLDADDLLLEEDRARLLALKAELDEETAVVMLPYHTGFDESGAVSFSYYRERLIKNRMGMRWVGAVHEVIAPVGKVIYGDCAVTHKKEGPGDADRNLRIFEGLLARGERLDARQRFYYGRELYYHRRYEEALAVLGEFLTDEEGWVENKIDACCQRAYCCYALGREREALEALLAALGYDLPRAEVCCDLGKHFFDREQWRQAAFWYSLAATCRRDDSRGGFTAVDCYGYLPCIQLCVCYSRLGEEEKAEKFNELAAAFKPEAEAVARNRAYFAAMRNPAESPI